MLSWEERGKMEERGGAEGREGGGEAGEEREYGKQGNGERRM